MRLILAAALIDRIGRDARDAFPKECCGLIEGRRRGDSIDILALHRARNRADRPDRFEIDPAAQFGLIRALRGTDRDIVGCYHSHPGGRPAPSADDRAGAGEDGFVWLIAAIAAPDAPPDLAAFLWRDGDFQPLTLG